MTTVSPSAPVSPPAPRPRRKRLSTGTILIYTVLSLMAILSFLPIWHVISLSVSRPGAGAAGLVKLWPVGFDLNAYATILKDPAFLNSFGISVKRVVLGVSVNLLLTILMAFPLSRETRHFSARNIYMWLMVFFMVFAAGLIPLFMLLRQLNLLDNIWSLILPGAVPVYNVILLMNFFRALPKEIDEAAYVDGATPWQLLWRIYLPLSLPALATVTLFSLVSHWNAFFDALVYMSSKDHYPLQTYIQQLVVNPDPSSNPNFQDELRSRSLDQGTLNAAKLVVTMIPILIIYPFVQRYFIKGIVAGSVKE